jgi:hypothetical protein
MSFRERFVDFITGNTHDRGALLAAFEPIPDHWFENLMGAVADPDLTDATFVLSENDDNAVEMDLSSDDISEFDQLEASDMDVFVPVPVPLPGPGNFADITQFLVETSSDMGAPFRPVMPYEPILADYDQRLRQLLLEASHLKLSYARNARAGLRSRFLLGEILVKIELELATKAQATRSTRAQSARSVKSGIQRVQDRLGIEKPQYAEFKRLYAFCNEWPRFLVSNLLYTDLKSRMVRIRLYFRTLDIIRDIDNPTSPDFWAHSLH